MNSRYQIKSVLAPCYLHAPLVIKLQEEYTHVVPPMSEYHSATGEIVNIPLPSLTFHPLSMMVVDNAVIHDKQAITVGDTILLETLTPGFLTDSISYDEATTNPDAYPGSLYKIPLLGDRSECKELPAEDIYCLVASTYNYNFAHWHTESLAAVQAVKTYLPGCKVLVPAWGDWQRESVVLAGIPEQDVVVMDNYPLRVPRLVVFSSTWLYDRDMYRVPPLYKETYHAITTNLEADDTIQSLGPRIYLSRLSSPHRKLLNEPDVIKVFEEFGFTIVSSEDIPYGQLLKTIHQSEVMAGPSGAALSRVGFCNHKTKFIELSFSGGWQSGWHALASIFSISENHMIYVESESNLNVRAVGNPILNLPQRLESWNVDISALRSFLTEQLATQ